MSLAVTDAEIHVSPGQLRHGSLQTNGHVIVESGDVNDDAAVIDGAGCSVVPLLVNTVFDATRPPPAVGFDLVPGNPATFAVVRGSVRAASIRGVLAVSPRDMIAVVIDGNVLVSNGEATRPPGSDVLTADDDRLGAWTDARRDMTQDLTADGRYSETRAGRRDAYTGNYWLEGDRIVYFDDTGFWAFGQYHEGVLHHAGFVLRK